MTRQRVKRAVPPESPYAAEVRCELSGEQLDNVRPLAAEATLAQDQLDHVVEDLDEVVADPEQALAQLRAEPDDDQIPWRVR